MGIHVPKARIFRFAIELHPRPGLELLHFCLEFIGENPETPLFDLCLRSFRNKNFWPSAHTRSRKLSCLSLWISRALVTSPFNMTWARSVTCLGKPACLATSMP